MHIGIDATALYGRYNGVEYALWNGLRALAELESKHLFTAWIPADGPAPADLAAFGSRWRWHRLPFAGAAKLRRIAWQQCELPRLLARECCDVLHAPTYVSPLRSPVPVVLTVYDLIALNTPEFATAGNRLHYRAVLPAALRHAARVIVPTPAVAAAALRFAAPRHSERSEGRNDRNEVEESPRSGPQTGATSSSAPRHSERSELASEVEESPRSEPYDKIRIIPLAVDPLFHPAAKEAIAALRARHNLPERYLLFVGNREPKKNLPRLLEALAVVAPKIPLVIAGEARAWGDELEIPSGLEVVRLGYLPREEIPALMSGCEAFLFPSLAEGFGLPVLEALACGAPVVAGTAVPIPDLETVTASCNPCSVPSIAAAIRLVMDDDALRASLAAGGPAFAAKFSNRRNAEQTLAVLEEAAGARRAARS